MINALFLWGKAYTALSDIYIHFDNKFFIGENKIINVEDLMEYINLNNINYVVIQNPYINEKRLEIYRFLKEKDIKILISDRGALPNSWFFDPNGFNAGSESYLSDIWDIELSEENKKKVKSYIELEVSSDISLENQGKRIGAVKLREQLNIDSNKKILFVPLQRPSDTVIKYFSGNVTSMEDFLENILLVQKSLKDKWQILVKKHPLEVEKLYEDKLFYVDDNTHFKDLIELSDAVTLINSGVGVISMMYQKPLFYFGKVFYSHDSINKEVKNSNELIEYLQKPLYKVDMKKVNRFISYLINDFYSFGNFLTEQRNIQDGTQRTITKKIDFYQINNLPLKSETTTLLVTDIDFFKADIGNRQRILRLIQYLNLHLRLKVLFLKKITDAGLILLKKYNLENIIDYIDDIEVTKKEIKNTKHFANNSLKFFYNEEIKTKFDKYLESNNYDNIIIEYIRLDYLLNNIKNKYMTFIDTHDLMSVRNEAFKKNNDKHHIVISREEEYKILDKYDYVLSIQKNEYKLLKENIKKEKNILVYHAVDIKYNYKANDKLTNIIFISGPSNYKHIVWLIENVWKYFINDKELILNIHGSVCNKLKQYKHIKNIKLRGYAKNLEEIYKNADLVINPVLYGGGLKIKNVEALSNSIPLITTDEGANGIEDGINYAYLLANTPDEWVESIVSLKLSKELRIKLSKNAFDYSSHYFTDNNCYEQLTYILKEKNEIKN